MKALDQRFDLVEVCLFPQQVRLCEVHGQGELGRPQEVEDIPEKGSVPIDKIIPLGITGGWEISPEHGAKHGVWITLQGG